MCGIMGYVGPRQPAPLALRSVTMDVFSIRARRSGDRIYYSLVDEYMDQEPPERFVVKPRWARKPLTMRQLISLIDEWREFNFDGCDIDGVFDFATASSEFYPQLARYYDAQNEAWRRERWKEREDDENEGPEG